jgi:regulator of sigma E protease
MTIIIVLVFILILGLLIFSHELGHFVVARRNGIKTDEFGFGFPPRIGGFVRVGKKWKFIRGNKEIESANTIYSINWIPMGGFVKIKGENGEGKKEKDSFASKKPWTRVKVLAAGVIMNFILAWFLYSVGYAVGNPEAVENGPSIQIVNVVEKSPASLMGLKPGDEIFKTQTLQDDSTIQINTVEDVQNYVGNFKGQEVNLKIKRGKETLDLKGVPRVNVPEGEGSLGIELAQVSIVKYPWYQAPWLGLLKLKEVFITIFVVLFEALKSLFIGKAPAGLEIAGPVKIFSLTGDFVRLGYIYVIQFAALLSVNLGIMNALPIPALDGGRILFILIEKIKGRPVKETTEQLFHTVGFFILIMLMVFIVTRELMMAFLK